jgi:hypothetical protein
MEHPNSARDEPESNRKTQPTGPGTTCAEPTPDMTNSQKNMTFLFDFREL